MIGGGFGAVTVGADIGNDTEGQRCIALRFGKGGGNATVRAINGAEVTLANIQDSESFPCRVLQVVSVTGTVANIVAIYEDPKS